MVPRSPALLALALLTAACASPEVQPRSATAPKVLTPPSLRIEPSRLIPDLDAEAPHGVEPDGTRRFLALQMRITERPDGSIRKAPGLLPAGRSDLLALSLPSRLGGGYLFVSATTSSTQLWRAEDWLSPLESLVRLSGRYDDIIAGFDRLYLASRRANTSTVAIDPASGEFRPLGPLPMPTGQGPMVFADAWRAVSVPDFRGPLATFDAGATWVPLGISEAVESLSVENDAILIKTQVQGRTYALDADGSLAPYLPPSAKAKPSEEPRPSRGRPLRLAIERGCPISPSRALVADGGDLLEVSMEDGSIVRTVRDAYPESFSECQGMALGTGVGFVCGARQGATVVYAYEAPRTLRSVLTYPEPKAVFSSGNGALVVRAPCPGGEPIVDQSQYCVRDVRGSHREIRFQGDLGAERVVALADGRVAILIAPRPGAEARLVVLDGSQAVTRSLSFDKLSQRQRALVRRGLWLQGAIEVKPGVLGVWVEGGGPVIGLHVGLDGKVEAGPLQTTPGIILVSGRVGLVWRYGGEGLETTDGGLTWREFTLPVARPGKASTTRGCSAVGCAVEGWLRVGWGKPADAGELEEATETVLSYPPYNRPLSLRLTCAPTGRASPPIATSAPPSPSAPGYRRPPSVAIPVGVFGVADFRGWAPFGPLAPPTLGPDQVGVAGGRDYGEMRFKAFAWGPKNADWSRAGRWMVAFDDPYDAVGLPVTTSPAASPWSDPTVASMLLNAVRSAVADPGGRSAVIGWCPGHNQCQVYSLTDGEAPMELLFSGAQMLPIIMSAVRSQEGWYLLSGQGTAWATVHAVDATGRVRLLGNYPRARAHQYDRLQLVRRARGPGIALWGVAPGADGGPRGFALPIDTATGELMAVQDGGPTDLGGRMPPRCAPGQDGWLLDMQPSVAPRLVLPEGAGFGGSIRMRVRVDGERSCVEAMSGRAREDEIRFGRHQAWLAGNVARTIPLAVWDAQTNRKYEMVCSADTGPDPDR